MDIHLYFCRWSRKNALETTSVYVDGFSKRLIPIFDNIEEEASSAAEEAWQSAMSSTAYENSVDPSDFAEAARDYGVEVYENLYFVRQQIIGLATSGLYHLWERLLKQFICKELRHCSFGKRSVHEEMAKADFKELEKLLSQFGFCLAKQSYYADLSQLRLVSNVIKHGDGPSCKELQAVAPEMFQGYLYHFDVLSNADSLELKLEDFVRYTRAITDFWNTFPENLTLQDEPS
jgi:hypothetical protein